MVDNLFFVGEFVRKTAGITNAYDYSIASNTINSNDVYGTQAYVAATAKFYKTDPITGLQTLILTDVVTTRGVSLSAYRLGQFKISGNLTLNEVRLLNNVDKIVLSDTRIEDLTLNFTNFNYFLETTPNTWTIRTQTSLETNFTPTSALSQKTIALSTVSINASYNDLDLDLYLKKVTVGINEYTLNPPRKIALLINTFDIPLVLISDTIPVFEYMFNRDLVVTRFNKNGTMLGELLPPTNPPVIIGKKFTVDFVNVTVGDDDVPIFEYSITPNPTVGEFTSLEVSQQDLFPKVGSPTKRTSTNYMTRKTGGFKTDDNERIRVIFTLRTVKDGNHVSIPYDFKYANDIFTLIETTAQEQQIKSSELYTTKVRDTYIDFLLINDYFNEDFVKSFKINAKEGNNSIPFTKINSQQSSQVMINLTGLKADTIYGLEIIALTDDDEFVIQNISVYTTITIPAIPTDTEKEKQAIQQVERMSFDNDLIESIEGLSLTEQKIIVNDAIKKLNDSDQVGIIHNRNVAIRKGGIYTKAESDTVKTNYRKTVEIILKTNSINIPAIDEGYYDSKTEET